MSSFEPNERHFDFNLNTSAAEAYRLLVGTYGKAVLRGYISFSGSKNQKNLYCLFLKYIILTMFLQNFIEIGALEPKIRPFIARSFWNYLMST